MLGLRHLVHMSFLMVVIGFLGVLGIPQFVMNTSAAPPAAIIQVTTTDDEYNSDGDCSLREAVIAANRNIAIDTCVAGTAAQDTILIPSGTYTLTLTGQNEDLGETGDLDVTGGTILQGSGQATTTIDGALLDRVLDVRGNTTVNVQIEDLAITGGTAAALPNSGGGIRSTANLTITNVTVFQNINSGILSNGTLSVLSSTIASNQTGPFETMTDGGGGLNTSGTVLIENSVIAHNTGNPLDIYVLRGAGWFHRGGTASVNNSTFSYNTFYIEPSPIPETGFAYGADIYSAVPITVTNSTIANGFTPRTMNIPTSVEGPITFRNSILSTAYGIPVCAGAVTSLGYNISNRTDCTAFTAQGDVLGSASLQLQPLTNNGGPTDTIALGAGSSAIDSGTPADCPTTDQRGVARPQDGDGDGNGACDRGAYEAGEGDPEPTVTPVSTITATPSVTPSPTNTGTPGATPTASPTVGVSPSPTATASPTGVPPSATHTPSPTATASSTTVPPSTMTATPTGTVTSVRHDLYLPVVWRAEE